MNSTGSCGAIVRDDAGDFLGATCSEIVQVLDATTAEAYALRDGLLLARRVACHNLIVQSDCLTIIDAMNSDVAFSSVEGPIL